jgi:superfamily II DNA/RNA helicase
MDHAVALSQEEHEETKEQLQATNYTLHSVRHFYVDCEKEEWKLETLLDLQELVRHFITFCKTPSKAEWLAGMINAGLNNNKSSDPPSAAALHDSTTTSAQQDITAAFRTGSRPVLVATDTSLRPHSALPATGLIVNYEVPTTHTDYLRRIIRTREGTQGWRRCMVISMVTKHDKHMMASLERSFLISIEELPADFVDHL